MSTKYKKYIAMVEVELEIEADSHGFARALAQGWRGSPESYVAGTRGSGEMLWNKRPRVISCKQRKSP